MKHPWKILTLLTSSGFTSRLDAVLVGVVTGAAKDTCDHTHQL